MGGEDFAVTAGWGHYGKDDAVMPGQGRVVERSYTPDERATLGDALPVLGENTFDVHLNGSAFWRNVPATVWAYQLGGYQVLKKWLSYREFDVLGRALLPEGSPALHRYLAADRGDSVGYRSMSLTQLAPEGGRAGMGGIS